MGSHEKSKPARVMVVDAVRGAAVLCMIQWHCADAWIGGALRESEAFNLTRIVGGFAAPLFLLLAGVSAALVFDPTRVWSGVRRGLGIVIGGYAFKLFAWSVDYGALVDRVNWLAIALDALALSLAWFAAEERTPRNRRALFAGLALLSSLATWFALNGATRTPTLIARLDVLQGIGAALVVVNGVLYVVRDRRAAPFLLALLAVIVALLTPSFLGADLSPLPTRLADYVARTDATVSGARFPLFPWLGYTLLGASLGAAVRMRPLASAWDVPLTRSGYVAVVVAMLVALCVFEPTSTAQWILFHSEQTRNLLRLVFNSSVALWLAGVSSIALPRLPLIERAVLSLGRHSLTVYVVHLEIAFGLPCSPIRETFGFGAWALGASALTLSMIGLSFWLDARARPKARDAVVAAGA